MNTKFKTSRQVVLTISVLLTAMWLPLTTFAQDFQKDGDLAKNAITSADGCAHCQAMHDLQDLQDCQHSHDSLILLQGSNYRAFEDRVGFGETDPADQQSLDTLTVPQTSNNRTEQVYVGFAETDPAYQRSQGDVTILQTSNNWVQQSDVGFGETDPAANLYRSGEEINKRIYVNCHDENGRSVVHGAPRFSNLTEEGILHDHS